MEKRLELIKTLKKEVTGIGCEYEVCKNVGLYVFTKMEANIHKPEIFWKYVKDVSEVIIEKAKTKKFIVSYVIDGETIKQTRDGYECLKSFITSIDDPKGIMTLEYGVTLKAVRIEDVGGKIIKVERDERGRIIIID